MRTVVLGIIAMLAIGASAPAQDKATRPAGVKVRIVLVGDSTVTDKAGWGGAFAKLLDKDVECVNLSAGGRSSRSFIGENRWQPALDLKPDYILIQFGHNDQPGKGPERETDPQTTYKEFMGRYVDDARSIGATPILVTSMTRRRFGPDGKIHSDLTAYVDSVKALAAEKKVDLIDLHARSIELLDRIGPEASLVIDPPPAPATQPTTQPVKPDKTHLSAKGAELMARLVADELKRLVPKLALHIR